MADNSFTTSPVVFNNIAFTGGLNTTGGPFAVAETESPKLQNVDFNIFGSVLQRNGYLHLTTASITTANSDGLYWFEYESSGKKRDLINVIDGSFYKMDADSGEPDGTWDDETNGETITADNHCDFVTWRNKLFLVNGEDAPLVWDGGSSTLTTAVVPTNVSAPKYIEQFNNYLFYFNVTLSSVREDSRFYWSNLNDETTWSATDFIRVSDNDGTPITGAKVLSDRLVVFKTRSIYNVFFTGDPDIPFVVEKSNSHVGCINNATIQEVQNGLVFLSEDGFYYYDGGNSYKISDKITSTLDTCTFTNARSAVYNTKNMYLCALTEGSSNDIVFVWDFLQNAWTLYRGIAPSAMARAFLDGSDERVYFADFSGYVYEMDTGNNDYPLGVKTAITSYYYTNWKPYGDLVIQKGGKQALLYHTLQDATIQFVYSYDFDESDLFSENIDMSGTGMFWDVDNWDDSEWVGEGGKVTPIDLAYRGRVIRFGFKNSAEDETWRIDGLGMYIEGETNR